MPNKNKNARRRRPVRQNKSATTAWQVSQLNLTTQHFETPQKPDIMRMKIPTNQIYTIDKVALKTLPLALTGSITFQLPDVNVNDLANSFDQFRIIQVSATFLPVGTGTLYVATAFDTTGQHTPTTIADVLQYDTCQVVPQNNGAISTFTRTFTPHTVQSPSAGSVVINPSRQWLPTITLPGLGVNPAPYYSIIYGYNTTPTVAPVVSVSYIIQFSNAN